MPAADHLLLTGPTCAPILLPSPRWSILCCCVSHAVLQALMTGSLNLSAGQRTGLLADSLDCLQSAYTLEQSEIRD